MDKKRYYRELNEIEEEYLRDHPDEIDNYLEIMFEEFATDGNSAALLSSLHVIAKVKGISEEINIERQELQDLDNINSIMKAMGYRLMPEKTDGSCLMPLSCL